MKTGRKWECRGATGVQLYTGNKPVTVKCVCVCVGSQDVSLQWALEEGDGEGWALTSDPSPSLAGRCPDFCPSSVGGRLPLRPSGRSSCGSSRLPVSSVCVRRWRAGVWSSERRYHSSEKYDTWWKDGWMDGQTIDGWMDGWQIYEYIDDRWIYGQMDGRGLLSVLNDERNSSVTGINKLSHNKLSHLKTY